MTDPVKNVLKSCLVALTVVFLPATLLGQDEATRSALATVPGEQAFNVKEFGAVGDGIAKETSGNQSAAKS